MLEVLGVDRVIAVDLQRPGHQSEGTSFTVPVETCVTEGLAVKYFAQVGSGGRAGGRVGGREGGREGGGRQGGTGDQGFGGGRKGVRVGRREGRKAGRQQGGCHLPGCT